MTIPKNSNRYSLTRPGAIIVINQPLSKQARDNYDRIFRKKTAKKKAAR